ncbi:MAG: hypothetical protein JWM50_305 [Microbacteriaceae bacterium]|jgi:hypothetical protein|nr:hypothetical protein [Microbacteriaceae bacterium]
MTVENPDRADDAPGRARTAPGLIAVVGAAAFAAVHIVAIVEATSGNYSGATTLAWVAIVGTTATLLLAIAAVGLDRGRRWGAVAIILSLVANPFILVRILGFFAAPQS